MQVKPFFHNDTKTFSYVVFDAQSLDAVIIDPVLDFDLVTQRISFEAVDQICDFLNQENLTPQLILDTHLHADHLSGAFFLKKRLDVKSAIGKNFLVSQDHFAKVYEITPEQSYDLLLDEKEIKLASLSLKTMFIPGHTASCAGYLFGDAFFCGDALFLPEMGCGRTDFPLGSAEDLYKSITQKIYKLPDNTRIFVGHDYPKDENAHSETSVLKSKNENILIPAQKSQEVFVAERNKRNENLTPPRLLHYALQVNICGGKLPDKFYKIPTSHPRQSF